MTSRYDILVEEARKLLAGHVWEKAAARRVMKDLTESLAFMLEHPRVVSPDGEKVYSKDDYDLCDRENENLRAHLAYAVERLGEADRKALAARMNGSIETGGVVEDSTEEEREELLRAVLLLKRCADHMEKAIHGRTNDRWAGFADSLVNQARGFEPILLPTLAELRGESAR
ncbi:hypothetical protein [Chenggangzhangella methanolivorans]|uniref:Uncharacterized protein n=1 Tax=Chenggangzhangella methanolivorans TaxID=1437009 RepID=A0A9E6R9G1_9HYPH|nr:hypothetical protein [Chenggangzhangella methanolivorans]QZN99759.1 hypothetical protein K6K41_24345 [Chenggangzhangella methanolivorans]